MRRNRLTWASVPPAVPDEGPASPAFREPAPHGALSNGTPSTWAEDPVPPPYPNAMAPATPDEGSDHPAYKAAAAKAYRCVRIATATFGDPMGDPRKEAKIQQQALGMMSLSDSELRAASKRLGLDEEEAPEETPAEGHELEARIARIERVLVRLAGEEEEEEEEPEAEGKEVMARLARLERVLIRLATEEEEEEPEAEGKEASFEDEELLNTMLLEEGMGGSDEDAMLAEMLAEEGMSMFAGEEGEEEGDEKDDDSEEIELEEPEGENKEACDDDMMDVAFGEEGISDWDPLESNLSPEEAMVLASLHDAPGASRQAAAPAGRTAGLRPQPRKPAKGATRLGGGTRTASTAGGSSELESLWATAPDVSKVF